MSSKKVILSVVGARPQFVKAAVVSRALQEAGCFEECLVHTGQHYDPEMSKIFFEDLQIPEPYKNLEVGSKSHAYQTAEMMKGLEDLCNEKNPDAILIYGDTNSTVAAALVGAKLQIPIAHVEAGLRSFNRAMPEEINRVVADTLSSLLFAPTKVAVENLKDEGITQGVHQVGDVMIDALYLFRDLAKERKFNSPIGANEPYFLLTLHRQENTDHLSHLTSILDALDKSPLPIIFPIHPRTKNILEREKMQLQGSFKPIAPVSYLDMMQLILHAEAVWTDSGGLQKEAVVLGKPCFTLRDETEWVETIESGWNQTLGADSEKIRQVLSTWPISPPSQAFPTEEHYGDGKTSEEIASILKNF